MPPAVPLCHNPPVFAKVIRPMLKIPQKILEGIIEHVRRDMPMEACGYLAGNGGLVVLYREMINVEASAEHFSFDAGEQFTFMREMRSKGLRIMAVYHSHPASAAIPSEEDVIFANDPDLYHVIVSLMGNICDVRSYGIRAGSVREIELAITSALDIEAGRTLEHPGLSGNK